MNVSNLSGNFIIDMDEVLVNISPAQYRFIRYSWIVFNPFFKDLGPLTDKQVLARPVFKLTDWLLNDKYAGTDKEPIKEEICNEQRSN